MESDPLSLLCDPDTRYSFERNGSTLRNVATGRVYPVRHGIPLFVSSLSGANLHAQAHYDRVAPFYDFSQRVGHWLGQTPNRRSSWLASLDLHSGMRVLEVGVGTGANLAYLPGDVDVYGVDLSWGMLNACSEKLKRAGRKAHLYQAEAERLPFRAAAFDCVFHTCGIRKFSSPARAVREMIWVARPGAQIVIVERAVQPGNRPGVAEALSEASLTSWVPDEMEEVRTHLLDGGALECLSFRLPYESPEEPTEEPEA